MQGHTKATGCRHTFPGREQVREELWAEGFVRLGALLGKSECESLRNFFFDDVRFRSTIEMSAYRFGEGRYRYFAYPLPEAIAALRARLYSLLAPVATDWVKALGAERAFPATLAEFLEECRAGGQTRPTPLLLRYQKGGYNCLHQDIYGDIVFPLQVILSLSDPYTEYDGGELMLVEQRPRAQSIGHVLKLEQGEAVAIATRHRPVKSARGHYRASVRHGVSKVTRGERFTLGVISHDAA